MRGISVEHLSKTGDFEGTKAAKTAHLLQKLCKFCKKKRIIMQTFLTFRAAMLIILFTSA